MVTNIPRSTRRVKQPAKNLSHSFSDGAFERMQLDLHPNGCGLTRLWTKSRPRDQCRAHAFYVCSGGTKSGALHQRQYVLFKGLSEHMVGRNSDHLPFFIGDLF